MKGDTKRRILDAALKLFAERGFNGVSVADIVEVVGIRKASFYSHFKSKTELFERLFSEFTGRMDAIAGGSIDYGARLSQIGLEEFLAEGLELYLGRYADPSLAGIVRIAQMEQYREPLARDFLREVLYRGPQRAAGQVFALAYPESGQGTVELLASEFQAAIMHFFQEYFLEAYWGGDAEAVKTAMRRHIVFYCGLLARQESKERREI